MISKIQKIELLFVIFGIYSIIVSPINTSCNIGPFLIKGEMKWVLAREINTINAYGLNATSDFNKTNTLDANVIIVAMISLVSAAFVAVLIYIFNVKQNRKLEKLKTRLETKKDQKAAKTDYEYVARKNLYIQFEPLLFQLHELSQRAYERIVQLAEDSRRGNLEVNGGWLSDCNGFYFTMTLYLLLSSSWHFLSHVSQVNAI